MSLRGRLEDLGVAEILHVVGAARRSGLLSLQAGDESAAILFHEGSVTALRGAGMPATLAELLAQAGALDTELREKATTRASAAGLSLDAALVDLGIASSFRSQQAIEAEIERRLPALLALKTGTFEFSLRQPGAPALADFGALHLRSGIPVSRLGAARGTVRIVPDGFGETTGARRARLLVEEERIALTPSGGPTPAPPRQAKPAPDPAPSGAPAALASPRKAGGRTVLHCLQAGPLRQGLLAALAENAIGALAVTSLADLDAGAEAARARGESACLVCQASHADLPGGELLARLRSVDASMPAVLVVASTWPVARQSAAMDRASRMGAGLIAVVNGEGSEADARDLADRVLHLLEPRLLAPSPPLPGTDSDEGLTGGSPSPAVRRDAPALATLARMLAAAGEPPEIARQLLDVAAEHFDRCFLFVTENDSLEPLGIAQAGSALPALPAGLALSALGSDFLSRAVRNGIPLDGPPPAGPGDAVVLRLLRAEDAARITVLPLLAAGGCFGALAAVSSEEAAASDDLALLSSFFMESSPALWEALSRDRRRAEASRSRS